jgi:plasmid stabilization system protein ParE
VRRKVVWSRRALKDLARQIDYIAADNPNAAQRIAERIAKAADSLGELPTGRPGRVAGTYEKLAPGLPYFIAYALETTDERQAVTILRVIHTARDWPDGRWPD